MKKEATDMSVSEMQKAMYMKNEKTMDDIMLNQILKQGSSFRPVLSLLLFTLFIYYGLCIARQ